MDTTLLNQGRKSKYRCWSWHDSDGFSIISLCFLVLSICVSVALVVKIYLGEPEVIPQGAVATDSKICSQFGIDVLKQGGNAVDAAIASTICMGVVNPHITGIGGGGIMIFHNQRSGKPPQVLNFRESATSSIQRTSAESLYGISTIGVPGLLQGLHLAHNKFGSLRWLSLFTPSVNLANEGVPVTQQIVEALRNLPEDSPLRGQDNIFFNQGSSRAEGETLKNPQLAETLSKIRDHGVGGKDSPFQTGELGLSLVNQMKSGGAAWDSADLSSYSAITENAIQSSYRNKTLYTSGAPSLGPQLLSLMNLLEGFNFSQQDLRSPVLYHLLTESIRISNAQAAHLGDPKFSPDIDDTVMSIINKTSSNDVRNQIRNDSLLPQDSSIPAVLAPAASVVSVVDNSDNYVTIVSGLNSVFGSQVFSRDGYLLNNAMANFYPENSTVPANSIEPRKRPLQPYTPLIAVENGRRCGLRLTTGAADPSQLAQVIFSLFQFDWSLPDAVQSGRLHATIQNVQIGVEDRHKTKISEEILAALANMGHVIKQLDPPYTSVNVIRKVGDVLASESDSRGGGYAIKYGP